MLNGLALLATEDSMLAVGVEPFSGSRGYSGHRLVFRVQCKLKQAHEED
jgi:hypothetical protein